jgi:hypothetical protein
VLKSWRKKSKGLGKKNRDLEALIPKVGGRVRRHWYSVLIVTMCIRLVLEAAISFRAAPKAVYIMFSQFVAVQKQRIPSYKTIVRWLSIVGLYKLNRMKEKSNDWALIVDNSVQIGTQKCLVILGTRLNIFRERALTFEDMEPILIELHDHSDASTIFRALERAGDKVGGVEMVCSDDGSDLRGGIKLFCEKHNVGRVLDITHKAATFVKRFLENDCEWQSFCTEAAEAKRKMQQTPGAHLVPPNQRTKSRFLNIECLTRWAVDVVEALGNPEHEDKEVLGLYCGWVLKYENLIDRLKQFVLIGQTVRQYIREKGFHKNTAVEAEKAFDALCLDAEGYQYAGMIIDFLEEQSAAVPANRVWIGSSEIIESVFGKVKHLEQDQSRGGFTSLILAVAACVGTVDAAVVFEAMEQTKIKDVNAWLKNQMGSTLLSERRKALGSWRKKRLTKIVAQELAGVIEGDAVCF